MTDVDTSRPAPPPPTSGRRTWTRGRTPLIVLITASALLVGSVTAVAASGGFSRGSAAGAPRSHAMMGSGGVASRSGMTNGSPAAAARGSAWLAGNGTAVTSIASARGRAAQAATNLNLHPGEVIWFDNGFYVELKDASDGSATEVIVDPQTGAVSTEPGPAMMWNTRYSMMRGTAGMMGGSAGMMGGSAGMMGGGAAPSGQAATVTADQSRSIAQQWLDANRSGQSAQAPDSYPGYYTMETTTSGKITGMLSVNATTGAVWYHSWHGRFIAREDS
jgi:hypothetical protein